MTSYSPSLLELTSPIVANYRLGLGAWNMAVAGYFVIRSLLVGEGWGPISEKLKTKWKGTVLASYKFWPPANVVNYSMVPLQYRVLYVNCLSFVWNGYLSHVNSSSPAKAKLATVAADAAAAETAPIHDTTTNTFIPKKAE